MDDHGSLITIPIVWIKCIGRIDLSVGLTMNDRFS